MFLLIKFDCFQQGSHLTTIDIGQSIESKFMNADINYVGKHYDEYFRNNTGRKCIIYYQTYSHFEILPTIIDSFLNLNQNINDFYLIAPKAKSIQFSNYFDLLNEYYANHIYVENFRIYYINIVDKNFLSKLNIDDIFIISTVYWFPGNLQRVKEIIDINARLSLNEYNFFIMFHSPPIQPTNKKQQLIFGESWKYLENETYYGLSLTPTFRLYLDQIYPIIPTYSYFDHLKSEYECHSKERYTIIIQGGDRTKRDRKLLLDILQNDIFKHQLQSRFVFKWYGFIDIDQNDNVDQILFNKLLWNDLLEIYNGLNNVLFAERVSFGDIYFSMISDKTIRDYNLGWKFTSTLIYSFSMERPVLMFDKVVNIWTQTFDYNMTSFLSYSNHIDIINILSQIAENDTYYNELCVNAQQMTRLIRQENKKILSPLLV